MLSMGITLKPKDFASITTQPWPAIIQFLLCYGVMPSLALLLGKAFDMDQTLIAGMVLVASLNGAQSANLCTYIARGDVALSVFVTTLTTLASTFMTPLLCKYLLGTIVPVNAMGIAISTMQVWTQRRRSRYICLQNKIFLSCYELICVQITTFYTHTHTYPSSNSILALVFFLEILKGCLDPHNLWNDNKSFFPRSCENDFTILSCCGHGHYLFASW